VSNLFFFGGVWAQTLVLGWLAFAQTGSEMLVAVFTAVRLAPMLLGPLAGALADRLDRVRLLVVAAGWAMCASGILATVGTVHRIPYWLLVLGGLVLGLAQSPSQPARASLVLDLVGRENLSNANALNALAMNMTQVLGPAIGGVMISVLGPAGALWVAAALYAASLVLLIPVRGSGNRSRADQAPPTEVVPGPGRDPRTRPRPRDGRPSGFALIARTPLAVAILLVTFGANVFLWPVFQGFMPVFAGSRLHLGPTGLSILLICSGVGGLVGALVIAALGDFRRKGAVFVIGTGIWAALWVLFAVSTSPVLSFGLMVGIGLASSAFGVLQTTLLLLTTDPAVHGRALGFQELAIGVMPLTTLVIGTLAEHHGIGPTTAVAGMLMVIFLVILSWRVPALLRFDGHEHDDPQVETVA
jgi:MFS family permease